MMNLLKKLAACGLSLTMILSLAACGGTDDTSSGESGGEPVKYLIGISQYGQHVLEDLNLGAGVPLSEDARVLELDLIEGLPFADQLREPGDAHIEVDQLIPGGLSHHAV